MLSESYLWTRICNNELNTNLTNFPGFPYPDLLASTNETPHVFQLPKFLRSSSEASFENKWFSQAGAGTETQRAGLFSKLGCIMWCAILRLTLKTGRALSFRFHCFVLATKSNAGFLINTPTSGIWVSSGNPQAQRVIWNSYIPIRSVCVPI